MKFEVEKCGKLVNGELEVEEMEEVEGSILEDVNDVRVMEPEK